MRQLLGLAVVLGLAIAKPEMYREKEDFQYSRSSSDDGSKSGYYGAQRGNMGGNYERAHNMDHLAQHQMGGLVRQVEGELGDGAKQRTGSVYTAANSRGVYGAGHYDLSNLEGRSFQEGVSYDNSQSSHSSLTANRGSVYKGQYAASTGSEYGASDVHSQQNSRYGGYTAVGNSEQKYSNNHLATDDLQYANQYEDQHAAHNSGHYSQARHQDQAYDQGSTLSHTSNQQGSAIHSRLISGTPVRIIIRPGTRIAVPVAAQTYDASQSTSSFDQNAINSEAEVLNSDSQHVGVTQSRPKHYESSYSYRKEWEKHDNKPVAVGVPLAIPTVNPYPAHSELYDEDQEQRASGIASQSQHSSNSGFSAHSTSSSQSRQQAEYNAQHLRAADNTESTAYTHGYKSGATGAYNAGARGNYKGVATGITSDASNLHNRIDDTNTNPKSYQSSYSYHKSWEHQGDPYIIKPSTNGLYNTQASEKLVAASLNQGSFGSHQYGSQKHQSHQSYLGNGEVDCDCDENGHIRVARSYSNQNVEDLRQQPQKQWDNLELGQHSQNKWDNLGELRQQAQNKWDKVEDLRQQTENQWDNLQSEGQQTQKLWDHAGQQTQQHWDKIEDLGQQAQTQWEQQTQEAGQQTQNAWDKLKLEPQTQTDQGQQTQNTWSMFEVQEAGNDDGTPEEKQGELGNPNEKNTGMNTGFQHQENVFQSTPSLDEHQQHRMVSHTLESDKNNQNQTHQVHSIWDEIKTKETGQENEDADESDLSQTADVGQQTQNTWIAMNHSEYSSNPTWHHMINKDQFGGNSEQNNEAQFSGIPMLNPHPWIYNRVYHHHSIGSNHSESSYSNSFSGSNSHSLHEHLINTNNNGSSNRQSHSSGSTSGSSVMSLWDKLDTIAKDTIPSHGNDNDGHYEGQQDHSNVFVNQNHQNGFVLHNTDHKHVQTTTASSTRTTSKPTTEAIKDDDNVRPLDIGRGDIGSDDLENAENDERLNSKLYKTSEETEALSLTEKIEHHNAAQNTNLRTEEVAKDFGVIGLGQQIHSEDHKFKEDHSRAQSGISITTTTPKSNYQHMHHSVNNHRNEETEWENNQFGNQNRHIFQQGFDRNYGQENIDKQTTDQKEDFGQQNYNFGQQTVDLGMEQVEPEFETQKTGQSESFHQEGKKLQTEDQQNEHSDQVSLSGWRQEDQQEHQFEQENFEQHDQTGWMKNKEGKQVQNMWEPTEDLQQHSQLADSFFQPPENLNQQVQAAWEPSDELQLHSQLSDTFPQAQETENLNQQVQAAWEPSDELQQHSQMSDTFPQAQETENLNQQVQAAWEPSDKLQQHSQMSDTFPQAQETENLNQQVQAAWEPSDKLQQHSQMSDTFPQAQETENLNQQVQDALKPTDALQHHSQLTDNFPQSQQTEKLNQQLQGPWEPTGDLQQQSQMTDTFLQPIIQNPPSTEKQQPKVSEDIIVPKKVADVDSPTETTTEKPGFWKSLGGKFTKAKDNVASWFTSS